MDEGIVNRKSKLSDVEKCSEGKKALCHEGTKARRNTKDALVSVVMLSLSKQGYNGKFFRQKDANAGRSTKKFFCHKGTRYKKEHKGFCKFENVKM